MSSSGKEDWENENPNLLNDQALLFQVAAKLPSPVTRNPAKSAEFLELCGMIRDIILENNIVQDAINRRDGIISIKETASAVSVIDGLKNLFSESSLRCLQAIAKYQSAPLWNDPTKNKILSDRSAKMVSKWKSGLNTFIESYMKIEKFIPKPMSEDDENVQIIENEKQQLVSLSQLVQELEDFLTMLETFSE